MSEADLKTKGDDGTLFWGAAGRADQGQGAARAATYERVPRKRSTSSRSVAREWSMAALFSCR